MRSCKANFEQSHVIHEKLFLDSTAISIGYKI